MKRPYLNEIGEARDFIRTFAGYDRRAVIAGGESSRNRTGTLCFRDTENVTADEYPTLRVRDKRARAVLQQITLTRVVDVINADGKLVYIRATGTSYPLVLDGVAYDLGLGQATKLKMIRMGAYIIVLQNRARFGDGWYPLRYINTADPDDRGSVSGTGTYHVGMSGGGNALIKIFPCDADGEAQDAPHSTTAPQNPAQGDWWIDTSGASADVLKRYDGTDWVAQDTGFLALKIYHNGGHVKFDFLKEGMRFNLIVTVASGETATTPLSDYEGLHEVKSAGHRYVVFPGTVGKCINVMDQAPEATVTIEGALPVMDCVFECNNRLWGCRYGTDYAGNFVNEIYASRLGDFRVWQTGELSDDGYRTGVGADGKWTGGIAFQGYPTFFKESTMYRVYGMYPSAYQLQQTPCDGVMDGSAESLAVVDNVLYYKSRAGVCAFTGSLPYEIGAIFGDVRYENAIGGGFRDKYWISMRRRGGGYDLFVYDAGVGVWLRDGPTRVYRFCACGDDFYALTSTLPGTASTYDITALCGDGESLVSTETNKISLVWEDQPIEWYVETGDLGLSSPDRKYVTRLTVRMRLAVGAYAQFFISYDDGEWEHAGTVAGYNLDTFAFPVLIRRCDHFRVRVEGCGFAQIYSIAKTMQGGTDI